MSTITQGFLDHKVFQIVSDVAASKGVRAFVIGGYVRDCFLGRPSKDIDIVVEGSGNLFSPRASAELALDYQEKKSDMLIDAIYTEVHKKLTTKKTKK